ncbi:MAG TPA: DUF1722 domain-containing protein, partial [Chloroflexi bacterium]|nr:DUF1722 domain-containing protein [Chloroflexota bacterium]
MQSFVRPRVVVSKCLGFEACRYNGVTIPDSFVQQLGDYVTYLPVCPEVEIGLGVPRDPIRIVMVNGVERLLQPATGADVTEKMHTFAEQHFETLTDIDGFILKGRSPSCGIKDVRRYQGVERGAASDKKGRGMFGGAVLERYPHLPVEEEGRLTNFTIREHFLTALFTLARFRMTKAAQKIHALVEFHSANKYLLMAYNESQLRIMGRIVANPDKKPLPEVLARYEENLHQALRRPPRRTTGINVLMHTLGYFSEQLTSEEKAYFLDTLEKYRAKKVPLSVPVSLINSWVIRFNEPYLSQQTFFMPYPEDLITISDS